MDVSHAILFLENADFVRITGLYFPAKFELYITESRLENRIAAGVTKKVRSLKLPGEVDGGLRSCEILHPSLRLFSNRATLISIQVEVKTLVATRV